MEFFRAKGYKLSYKDGLQLDGAFSAAHINYGKSPEFNGVDSKDIAKNSRKNSISSKNYIEDISEVLDSFNGTEKDFKKADRIELWKNYWLEYVNAFDKLTNILPKSIVTAYTGRQAIELGFKYLLVQNDVKEGELKTHDLKKLSDLLNSKNIFAEEYMEEIPVFCEKYCQKIEGENVEYFRYPEYGKNTYFAGNQLDIEWLSYNFALIILKLLHLVKL